MPSDGSDPRRPDPTDTPVFSGGLTMEYVNQLRQALEAVEAQI
jgi:hypothetical protein